MSNSSLKLEKIKLIFAGEARLDINELLVQPGQKVLVLGANGAGKTSLLNIISGANSPSQGTINNPMVTSYFAHQPMLYPALRVSEQLDFWGAVLGIPKNTLASEAEYWRLSDLMNKLPSQLSRGEQARVALARTFASRSDLLLLDEPTTALDQEQLGKLYQRIKADDRTIIASSHNIEPSLFTRALILEKGQIMEDFSAPFSKPLAYLNPSPSCF